MPTDTMNPQHESKVNDWNATNCLWEIKLDGNLDGPKSKHCMGLTD